MYKNKTLIKHNLSPSQFSPLDLITPNKDNPGISKTVFTHISNLHGLLNDWVAVRDKGTKICKTISALKLHEFNNDYYPQQLRSLTESILEALDSLKNILEGVETIDKQLDALARLQVTNQPVMVTWSAKRIYENVNFVLNCLKKEYGLKYVITENIAHCRDANLIEVYASSWEFEAYFNANSYAYLFAEVGMPSIT